MVLKVAPLFFVVLTAALTFSGAYSFPLFLRCCWLELMASLLLDVIIPSLFFCGTQDFLNFADLGPYGSAIVTILREDPVPT